MVSENGGSRAAKEEHKASYPQDLQGCSRMRPLFLVTESVTRGPSDVTVFTSEKMEHQKKEGEPSLATGMKRIIAVDRASTLARGDCITSLPAENHESKSERIVPGQP